MKIKSIIKKLEKNQNQYFQPDNPDLGVIGTNFEGVACWYDSYGNPSKIQKSEMENNISGRMEQE